LADALTIAARTRGIAIESVSLGMALCAVAMGFAAAGLLSPVIGAVVQELIDVASILNALRALSGPASYDAPPETIPPEVAARLRAEHRVLAPLLQRIRSLADALDAMPRAEARRATADLSVLLQQQLLPHEHADERELYPHFERVLGGDDPMAALSRTHREIHHMSRLLERSLEGLEEDHRPQDRIRETRRLLYGLEAVLQLHFAQEEELFATVLGAP
jgi:hypothetical protein